MSIYKIENNEVIFNAINESILELMKNSSKVIDHKGFHKLPKVYTRKDYNYIKLADAEGDTPTDVAETPQSIQTPAIRVKPKGKTAEIGVQDIKQTMDENEEVTVTPYSNKIETYNGESTTVDAKINVMYHSGLTVKAAKILEDQ
ncbi:hypothetical protein SAMN05216388_105710 [Halorientalis persicus]|uniref:Uncharacterized protein n=2 Tax=Halorientalis persicus TaxID=1367881 RepID=A0A1H8WGL0_9EURY|nr:hypothetical protein SAMN05216388_105710 [Halorientalis persicus]